MCPIQAEAEITQVYKVVLEESIVLLASLSRSRSKVREAAVTATMHLGMTTGRLGEVMTRNMTIGTIVIGIEMIEIPIEITTDTIADITIPERATMIGITTIDIMTTIDTTIRTDTEVATTIGTAAVKTVTTTGRDTIDTTIERTEREETVETTGKEEEEIILVDQSTLRKTCTVQLALKTREGIRIEEERRAAGTEIGTLCEFGRIL